MPGFVSHQIENINHILCPAEISRDAVIEFEDKMKGWLSTEVQTQVLDFRNVKKIHPSFFPIIAKFKQHIDKSKKRLVSVNVTEDTSQVIIRSGMDKAFGMIKLNKVEKAQKAQNAKPKMNDADVRMWLVRYLVQAARAAMNTMFNTTVAADENYQQAIAHFSLEKIFRAAAVRVDCALIKANFRLFFDKDCLLNLARATLGEIDENDVELIDSTATELLNLIYGGAKSRLNDDKEFDLPPAIPKLIHYDDVIRLQIDKKTSVLLPFATALGTFHLQIEFT